MKTIRTTFIFFCFLQGVIGQALSKLEIQRTIRKILVVVSSISDTLLRFLNTMAVKVSRVVTCTV